MRWETVHDLGGDGQADHQRRRGDAQHRCDPKPYPPGQARGRAPLTAAAPARCA